MDMKFHRLSTATLPFRFCATVYVDSVTWPWCNNCENKHVVSSVGGTGRFTESKSMNDTLCSGALHKSCTRVG